MNKKVTRSRLAIALAAVGVLVMSSGATLLIAGPAHAATPVNVCHATSSDQNPYEYIQVDDDAAVFEGHLAHRDEPVHTWKDAGSFNGVEHEAGAPKADLIQSYTDEGGVFHELDGTFIDEAFCNGLAVDATAAVTFTDPTCENENEATFETSGTFVTFAVTDGEAAPGASIEVTATADAGHIFDGGSFTQVFSHDFAEAVDLDAPPCAEVIPPPTVEPPTVTPAPQAPPTVVRAGLMNPRDLSQEGLILLMTGLLLLVGAAGLGLTRPAKRQTI